MVDLSTVLASILACYGISVTITREYGPLDIFLRFRNYLGKLAAIEQLWLLKFLADVSNCPRCFGFWSSLLISLTVCLMFGQGIAYGVILSAATYGGNLFLLDMLTKDEI